MGRERIFYLDFIRALSAITIITFHFNLEINDNRIYIANPLPVNGANIDFGNVGVSLFFIISGAALMYTYSDGRYSIKEYFFKRFLSIYPAYYISYAIAFLYFFYLNSHIKHSVPGWTFVFTILGLDGYLGRTIPNYYLLGEWFLGCIILLYLIFPFLRKLVIKKPYITAVILIIYYVLLVTYYPFKMRIDWNFITRIPDFMFGMYFVKYGKKIGFYQFLLYFLAIIIMWLLPINVTRMYKITVFGILVFICLIYLSGYVRSLTVKKFIQVVSRYSYPAFLVHHIIIRQVMKKFIGTKLTNVEILCLYVITIGLIALFSFYIEAWSKKVAECIKRKSFLNARCL